MGLEDGFRQPVIQPPSLGKVYTGVAADDPRVTGGATVHNYLDGTSAILGTDGVMYFYDPKAGTLAADPGIGKASLMDESGFGVMDWITGGARSPEDGVSSGRAATMDEAGDSVVQPSRIATAASGIFDRLLTFGDAALTSTLRQTAIGKQIEADANERAQMTWQGALGSPMILVAAVVIVIVGFVAFRGK